MRSSFVLVWMFIATLGACVLVGAYWIGWIKAETRQIQADLRADSHRISGNAVAIDYTMALAEACAEKLGVSIAVREPGKQKNNRHDKREVRP